MTNFREFFEKPEKPQPRSEAFRGTFECQDCAEPVDTAYYFRSRQVLEWTCSSGHKSQIDWNS